MVLGGLVEGAWPPESRTDAWLSRPMRQQLGLDLPERRVGLSAHDFAQMLGAPRSDPDAAPPRSAARRPRRRASFSALPPWPVRGAGRPCLTRGEVYLGVGAHARPAGKRAAPSRAPAPKPPRAARPKRLSVTEIEHWLRDPYTIYAKHVLRLAPLDEVDAAPGAAERGTVIQMCCANSASASPTIFRPIRRRELIAMGKKHFAALEEFPEARAFWWPRFRRIAQWFGGWEAGRRANFTLVAAEVRGQIEFPLTGRCVHAERRCRPHRTRQ